MIKTLGTASILAVIASASHANLDRGSPPPLYLFAEGTVLSFGLSFVEPEVSGTFENGTVDTGNVAGSFTRPGISFKTDLNEQFSIGVLYSTPYGAGAQYPDGVPDATNPPGCTVGAPGCFDLGGVGADVIADEIEVLLRYKMTDSFSVFGGPRFQKYSGEFVQGGFTFELDDSYEVGYSLGVAFEIPAYAIQASLTYTSAIEHKQDTTIAPGVSGGEAVNRTPEAIQLAFQAPVAPKTIAFGTLRYAKWSSANISLLGQDLTDFDDVTSYSVGIGRRVTDKLALSVAYAARDTGESPVFPVTPTTGSDSILLGARYNFNEQITFNAGYNYSWLRDAVTTVGGNFEDNTGQGLILAVDYRF